MQSLELIRKRIEELTPSFGYGVKGAQTLFDHYGSPAYHKRLAYQRLLSIRINRPFWPKHRVSANTAKLLNSAAIERRCAK